MSAKAQSAARKFSARVTAMCLALSRDEDKEEHLSERICSDERLKEGDLAACEGAACLGAVLRCRSMSSSSDDINAKLLCKVATKVVLAVAAAVSAAPKGEETSSEGGAWKQAELWGGEQVDSWLGDALAALPLKKRTTSGFRKVGILFPPFFMLQNLSWVLCQCISCRPGCPEMGRCSSENSSIPNRLFSFLRRVAGSGGQGCQSAHQGGAEAPPRGRGVFEDVEEADGGPAPSRRRRAGGACRGLGCRRCVGRGCRAVGRNLRAPR